MLAGALVLVLAMAGSIGVRRQVDGLRGKEATLEDILYVPSSNTLKHMSLGYSGLLADVYWTRAVQYFGGKRNEKATRFDLLFPLLDITTDLDPNLIPAYEYGSHFLSFDPPDGPGTPDKAVALAEKGLRANPEYWRLYFTIGFIHYLNRNDPKAAYKAFLRGSAVPGAAPWMRVMAASMAEHAGETDTAYQLWKHLLDTARERALQDTAQKHVNALEVDRMVQELEDRVRLYADKIGRRPATWNDLVRAGFLRGIPLDPTGVPYKLMPNGGVEVQDPTKLPFITRGLIERGK